MSAIDQGRKVVFSSRKQPFSFLQSLDQVLRPKIQCDHELVDVGHVVRFIIQFKRIVIFKLRSLPQNMVIDILQRFPQHCSAFPAPKIRDRDCRRQPFSKNQNDFYQWSHLAFLVLDIAQFPPINHQWKLLQSAYKGSSFLSISHQNGFETIEIDVYTLLLFGMSTLSVSAL